MIKQETCSDPFFYPGQLPQNVAKRTTNGRNKLYTFGRKHTELVVEYPDLVLTLHLKHVESDRCLWLLV